MGMNQKQVICYVILALMFILAGSSNEIPDTCVDRIFVPLHGANWSFHYAGIFLMIIIYTCFKQLNLQKENAFFKTRWRRIIATFLFLNLSTHTANLTVQLYKSFSSDLSSIYLNRQESHVSVNGRETELKLEGQLELKNCSNEEQWFYLTITMPTFVEEAVGMKDVIINQAFNLPAKTKQRITIDDTFNIQMSPYYSFNSNAYEYTLFNEKSEIIFKGSFDQYLFH